MSKRMAMAGVMCVASLAASLLAPTAAYAADGLTVSVVKANGSGCPTAKTVDVTPTTDQKAFTLTYNAFEVRGGRSKNCQLTVKVHVAPGITYAIYEVENRGDAYLRPGVSGKNTLTAYFAGSSNTLVSRHEIRGPFDDVWQAGLRAHTLDWAPCNVDRNLNVNNILRVTGNKVNYMNMFSTDLDFSVIFHLQFKRCW